MMLKIEVVENGFLVCECGANPGLMGKQWVFQTPLALSDFMVQWGVEQETRRDS